MILNNQMLTILQILNRPAGQSGWECDHLRCVWHHPQPCPEPLLCVHWLCQRPGLPREDIQLPHVSKNTLVYKLFRYYLKYYLNRLLLRDSNEHTVASKSVDLCFTESSSLLLTGRRTSPLPWLCGGWRNHHCANAYHSPHFCFCPFKGSPDWKYSSRWAKVVCWPKCLCKCVSARERERLAKLYTVILC